MPRTAPVGVAAVPEGDAAEGAISEEGTADADAVSDEDDKGDAALAVAAAEAAPAGLGAPPLPTLGRATELPRAARAMAVGAMTVACPPLAAPAAPAAAPEDDSGADAEAAGDEV